MRISQSEMAAGAKLDLMVGTSSEGRCAFTHGPISAGPSSDFSARFEALAGNADAVAQTEVAAVAVSNLHGRAR